MPAAVVVQDGINHRSADCFSSFAQLIASALCFLSSMAMAQMTDQFKGEFKAVLNAVNMTPNGKMQKLMDMLKAQNISYSANQVHCSKLLVHQANRGGLGLDRFNVHKCGANILRVGANMNKLDAAVAIELAPNGAQHNANVKFNSMLVSKSEGMIAPLTGAEKFLTLGCGHTAAFCKQAAIGGNTPEGSLADEAGNISMDRLSKDLTLMQMISKGWDWVIVPWQIDVEFPSFAHHIQKALNSSNHVANLVSELETAVSLSVTLQDQGMSQVASDQAEWETIALNSVTAIGMDCAKFAPTILAFVKQFGGGAGAPMVKLLDRASKQFKCSVPLGESFWKAITNLAFKQTCQFPLVRVALMLGNLTCPPDSVKDGIARLIIDTDVKKLASKGSLAKVEEAEKILKGAFDMNESLVASSQHGLTEAKLLQPLGQLFVRVALKLVDKEKFGIEGKNYSYCQIKKAFLLQLSTICSSSIECTAPGWQMSVDVPAESDDEKPASKPSAASGLMTLQDHVDTTQLLANKGYTLGSIVFEKSTGSGATNLFIVTSVGDECGLQQICNYSLDTQTLKKMTVPATIIIDGWALFRNDPPVKLTHSNLRDLRQCQADDCKAFVYQLLWALDKKHTGSVAYKHLVMFRKPDVLMVSKQIAKGDLILVPFGPMSSLCTNKPANGMLLASFEDYEEGSVSVYIATPAKPAYMPASPAKCPEGSQLIPYWCVGSTANKKEVNMIEDEVVTKGIKIPVLINNVVLEKHAILLKYKAHPRKAAPFQGATVVSGAEPASGSAKKKARKA